MTRKGWGALGAAIVLMTGCSTAQSSAPTAKEQSAQPYVSWKVGSPKTLVTCLDVTASVPRGLVKQSEGLVAQEILAEPKPGAGHTVAYIRTISDNSVNPSNNLLTVNIPAVPKPVERKLSVFDPHKQDAARRYQAAVKHEQTTLQRAKSIARTYAAKIRSLHPHYENRATDLYACPAVAQRLFLAGSQSWLLVVSDLLPSGRQTTMKFNLPGTHLVIFQYCGTDLTGCQTRLDRFTHTLKQAGAGSTRIYDITQIGVLQHVLPGF